MEKRMVQVKEHDEAAILCPGCSKVKNISVESYRRAGKRDLRVKCSCGELFGLCLEYRKYYRKPVKLLGKSINFSNHRETQDIVVKNISMGGIGFCPFQKHKTRQGDRLQVFFELNDSSSTAINTDVTVCTVRENYVGCGFINTRGIRESLGFFLMR